MRAYGHSKTATILHANHFDRLYGADPEHPAHCFSVHCGAVMTAVVRSVRSDAEELFDRYRAMLKSPEQGAAKTVWRATGKRLERKGRNLLRGLR